MAAHRVNNVVSIVSSGMGGGTPDSGGSPEQSAEDLSPKDQEGGLGMGTPDAGGSGKQSAEDLSQEGGLGMGTPDSGGSGKQSAEDLSPKDQEGGLGMGTSDSGGSGKQSAEDLSPKGGLEMGAPDLSPEEKTENAISPIRAQNMPDSGEKGVSGIEKNPAVEPLSSRKQTPPPPRRKEDISRSSSFSDTASQQSVISGYSKDSMSTGSTDSTPTSFKTGDSKLKSVDQELQQPPAMPPDQPPLKRHHAPAMPPNQPSSELRQPPAMSPNQPPSELHQPSATPGQPSQELSELPPEETVNQTAFGDNPTQPEQLHVVGSCPESNQSPQKLDSERPREHDSKSNQSPQKLDSERHREHDSKSNQPPQKQHPESNLPPQESSRTLQERPQEQDPKPYQPSLELRSEPVQPPPEPHPEPEEPLLKPHPEPVQPPPEPHPEPEQPLLEPHPEPVQPPLEPHPEPPALRHRVNQNGHMDEDVRANQVVAVPARNRSGRGVVVVVLGLLVIILGAVLWFASLDEPLLLPESSKVNLLSVQDLQNQTAKSKLNIMIVGKQGIGKKTLVDELFGKETMKCSDDKFAVSAAVCKKFSVKGISFQVAIFDSAPNLNSQHVQSLDLVVFALRMDDTRYRGDDQELLQLLSRRSGLDVWSKGIIALTFANRVSYVDKDTGKEHTTREHLLKKKNQWKNEISGTLKSEGVTSETLSEIPAIPVGHPSKLQLYADTESWKTSLLKCMIVRPKETAIETSAAIWQAMKKDVTEAEIGCDW